MADGSKAALDKKNHNKEKTGLNTREANANVYKATRLSRELSGTTYAFPADIFCVVHVLHECTRHWPIYSFE